MFKKVRKVIFSLKNWKFQGAFKPPKNREISRKFILRFLFLGGLIENVLATIIVWIFNVK